LGVYIPATLIKQTARKLHEFSKNLPAPGGGQLHLAYSRLAYKLYCHRQFETSV